MKRFGVGDRTIKSRVIRYNFITVCLVAVIASVCSYLTSTKKTVEIAGNSLEYHVSDISYRCEKAYEELLNLVLSCSARGAFDLDELQKLPSSASGRQGLNDVNTLGTFCALTGYSEYISKLSLFNDRGVMIQRGTAFGSQDDRERILNAGWFEREVNKPMDAYQLELVPSPFYRDDGSMIFPIAADMAEGNGWVLLCVSPRLFEDILKETSNGQEVVLMTASGQRIASVHEEASHREDNDRLMRELIGGTEQSGRRQSKVHGQESLISWKRYARSGVMVYSSIPLESLRNDRLILSQTFLILFLGCLAIGLILSVLFTNQLNKPMERLISHLQQVAGGDFSQDQSIETDDEVGMIGRMVNEMSGRIDKLMTQQMEDQREKSSLELKMLQAQINPHFLYNTLDSIKWIAVIQKNTGIVKVVTALSGLLRNMAKGFNEQVSVGQELDFLNDYVTIEKVRHAELFDLEVLVDDPALYDARVIKLTLQPLVENAIFSGIEPGGKHGTIWIHVYAKQGDLYMSVRDDGVGIPEETCRTILEDTERVKGDHMSSIGLANVQRRIQLTYGGQYGLSVDSVEGSYTEIVVHTPLIIEKKGGGHDVPGDDCGR